jgi:hypothetical protein
MYTQAISTDLPKAMKIESLEASQKKGDSPTWEETETGTGIRILRSLANLPLYN